MPVIIRWATMGVMNSLDGIRILDLSRVLAGPWCTQNLADLGADVLKVERPGQGDDTRRWGPPYLKDAQGQESAESAYYLSTNRNKRSITCDISQAEGQALIKRLVPHCDVFIENFKVGDMARYGLDFDSLKTLNPRLVYCSITGYGQTGPYRERAGYDYAIQGTGGLMSVTGERDDLGGGPQKVGVAVADLFTGMYATVAILAALRHAERTGEGQAIDMALLDTQVAMLANLGATYLVGGRYEGKVPGRMGNAHQNVVPYQVFEVAPTNAGTRDYMILAVGNDSQFAKFCAIAGHPEWATDWLSTLEAAKVPCGPINNMAEVFADPHVQAREMINHWTHHASGGEMDLVASPLKLRGTPVRRDRPPPVMGQHTDEVLGEVLGLQAAELAALRARHII